MTEPRYGRGGGPSQLATAAWDRRTTRAAGHDLRVMTSLLPSSTKRTAADVERDLATRRPLALLAVLGGVAAAASTLVFCLGIAVVGWFLTDAGAHGAPSGALRVGALGWLTGHGSGVRIDGVTITAVPLGITLLAAWAVWRLGQRVGDSISGHGPDADAIADGERDWTVPIAVALFTAGYVVTAVITTTLAASPATDPSAPRVVLWSMVLCLGVGGPAIALGSGRAAIWAADLPPGRACRRPRVPTHPAALARASRLSPSWSRSSSTSTPPPT